MRNVYFYALYYYYYYYYFMLYLRPHTLQINHFIIMRLVLFLQVVDDSALATNA